MMRHPFQQKNKPQKNKSSQPIKSNYQKNPPISNDDADFAEEFTTSGVEKNYWHNPPKENNTELLI